jgi:hypothetical protein
MVGEPRKMVGKKEAKKRIEPAGDNLKAPKKS